MKIPHRAEYSALWGFFCMSLFVVTSFYFVLGSTKRQGCMSDFVYRKKYFIVKLSG